MSLSSAQSARDAEMAVALEAGVMEEEADAGEAAVGFFAPDLSGLEVFTEEESDGAEALRFNVFLFVLLLLLLVLLLALGLPALEDFIDFDAEDGSSDDLQNMSVSRSMQ